MHETIFERIASHKSDPITEYNKINSFLESYIPNMGTRTIYWLLNQAISYNISRKIV